MSAKRSRRRRRILVLAALIAAGVLVRGWAGPWAVEYAVGSFLAERLRGRAEIGGVDLAVLAGRVTLRDVVYRDPNGRPILRVASARLHFSLADLVTGVTRPARVELDRVYLQVEASPDGTNLEANLRPPAAPSSPSGEADAGLSALFPDRDAPHLVLRETTLDLSAPAWLRRDIRLRLDAEILPSALAAHGAQVKLDLRGDPDPARPESRLSPISLLGRFDTRTTQFQLGTDSRGIRLTSTVRELLARPLAESSLGWLNPAGSVLVEVAGSLHAPDGFPDVQVSLLSAGGLEVNVRDFPYALSEVQGRTRLGPGAPGRRGEIVLEKLLGTHGRATARVQGSIFGFLEPESHPWAHLLIEGHHVPLDQDLRHALDRVEPELGRIWDAVSPQGTTDFQCLLYKRPEDRRVRASLAADLRDGVFEYAGFAPEGPATRISFPYRLEEVSGTLSSHLGHSRFDLAGRGVGGSRISVRGVARDRRVGGDQPALEVWIHGEDVPLDATLRRAIEGLSLAWLWPQLSPQGRAGVEVHLSRRRPDSSIDYELRLHLDGKASFAHEVVPMPVTEVSGTVHMRSDWRFPRIENVRGQVGQGTLQMHGTLSEFSGEPLEIKLNGRFLGEELTRALLRSPREELRRAGDALRHFEPVGHAASSVVLTGLSSLQTRVRVEFQGGGAVGPALPFSLTSLTGAVTYDGHRVHLRNVVGWRDKGWVEVNGEQRFAGPDGYVDIRVAARQIHLAAAKPPEVGPLTLLRPILDELRPLGMLPELDFRYDSREPDRFPNLRVTARDVSLRPTRSFLAGRPLGADTSAPIRIRSGGIHYDPTAGLQCKRLDVGVGAARLRDFDGVLSPGRPDREAVLRLTTRVEHLTLDSDLFAYVDGDLAATLRATGATGTLYSDALSLEARRVAGGGCTVRFTAPSTVRLAAFRANLGPEFREVNGAIRLEADSTFGSARNCRLRARIQGLDFRIFDLRLGNAEGTVFIEPAEDADDAPLYLHVRDLAADFYGGRLGPDCNLDVLLAAPYPIEGALTAARVRVQPLLRDFAGSDRESDGLHGILNARFRFQADRAEIGSVIAAGEAKVTQGRFGSVPAFVSLFNYFNNHFDRLESTHIEIVDRKIHLGSEGHIPAGNPVLASPPDRRRPSPSFRLAGDALDLQGAGYINFGGELEFQLQPRDLWLSTPIPGIRHVLDLLLRQTGTIYVLGTVERIDMQPILFGLSQPDRGRKQPLRIEDRPLWPATRW